MQISFDEISMQNIDIFAAKYRYCIAHPYSACPTVDDDLFNGPGATAVSYRSEGGVPYRDCGRENTSN